MRRLLVDQRKEQIKTTLINRKGTPKLNLYDNLYAIDVKLYSGTYQKRLQKNQLNGMASQLN